MTIDIEAARAIADCCERSGGYCGDGLMEIIKRQAAEIDRLRAERDSYHRIVAEAHEALDAAGVPVRPVRPLNDRIRALAAVSVGTGDTDPSAAEAACAACDGSCGTCPYAAGNPTQPKE